MQIAARWAHGLEQTFTFNAGCSSSSREPKRNRQTPRPLLLSCLWFSDDGWSSDDYPSGQLHLDPHRLSDGHELLLSSKAKDS
jgi:hypothetical protein